MLLVHKDAGDPPLRKRRRVLVVFALVLYIGELVGTAVLTPALCFPAVVEDEFCVGSTRLHSIFLDLSIVQTFLTTLWVV
jgi:hypothetical protein